MTEKEQLFKNALESGIPYRQIAKILGITMRQCFRIRAAMDLPRRPTGRKKCVRKEQ